MRNSTNNSGSSYLREIIKALESLNGAASLKEINDAIERNGNLPSIHTNKDWKRNVSAVIQRHCIGTKSYRGAEDIFYSVYGLGEGYWGLKAYNPEMSATGVSPIEQRQIDAIQSDVTLNETEKEAMILSRRGQGDFRRKIIKKYRTCIVTGIEDHRLLVASHVKPWRSSVGSERLSENNGLLLSSLYDRLFDIGLITFKIDGCIAVSSRLSTKDRSIIQIDETQKFIYDIPIELKRNLEYHNDKIFIK